MTPRTVSEISSQFPNCVPQGKNPCEHEYLCRPMAEAMVESAASRMVFDYMVRNRVEMPDPFDEFFNKDHPYNKLWNALMDKVADYVAAYIDDHDLWYESPERICEIVSEDAPPPALCVSPHYYEFERNA